MSPDAESTNSQGLADQLQQNLANANPSQVERLYDLVAQKATRRLEPLRLYRPLPHQSPFHHSKASERVVRGGNRSGKSTSAFVEVASAATGVPITDHDGKEIPFNYPKRPLRIWIIGLGESHIGQTIYRMLFMPGVFKVITDEETGLPRAYRPWDPEDVAREDEVKESAPLIPERLIDPNGWAWKDKRQNVFSKCVLWNGTEIFAYTSNAKPKMGDPVDIILIDEDIEYPEYVAEWQARLSDRKGRLIWAAFPYSKNNALIDMCRRAQDQASEGRENPDVEEIVLKFSDNPFMDKNEIRKRREGWSEDECRARDDGEFITDTFLVYPNYTEKIHGWPKQSGPIDKVEEALDEWGGNIPPDWCRYLALDPGHQVAAVLFCAIPPPWIGDAMVIYDEVYARREDARGCAKQVAAKATGQSFEAFIIDARFSRQSAAGFGKTIGQQYSEAFAAEGLYSSATGCGFQLGSDNIGAGVMMVRGALTVRGDGTPKLRTIPENLPNFKREINLYRKQVTNREIVDKPIDKDNHLMDCLRYLAAAELQWHQPKRVMREDPFMKAFKRFMSRGNKETSDTKQYTMGPASASRR